MRTRSQKHEARTRHAANSTKLARHEDAGTKRESRGGSTKLEGALRKGAYRARSETWRFVTKTEDGVTRRAESGEAQRTRFRIEVAKSNEAVTSSAS